jgi:hypothetical protein
MTLAFITYKDAQQRSSLYIGGSHRPKRASLCEQITQVAPEAVRLMQGLVSRVKKIIQLDKDIAQCSHNATFLITMATVGALAPRCPRSVAHVHDMQEMFIEYLAEQGHNVMRSERKPRKTLQYKDLGRRRGRPFCVRH